nr:MAG TPA: hypothetical protein [Caudoviricetes sp.]
MKKWTGFNIGYRVSYNDTLYFLSVFLCLL